MDTKALKCGIAACPFIKLGFHSRARAILPADILACYAKKRGDTLATVHASIFALKRGSPWPSPLWSRAVADYCSRAVSAYARAQDRFPPRNRARGLCARVFDGVHRRLGADRGAAEASRLFRGRPHLRSMDPQRLCARACALTLIGGAIATSTARRACFRSVTPLRRSLSLPHKARTGAQTSPEAGSVTSRQPAVARHTVAAPGWVRCSSASIAATDRPSVMPPRSVRSRSIRAGQARHARSRSWPVPRSCPQC